MLPSEKNGDSFYVSVGRSVQSRSSTRHYREISVQVPLRRDDGSLLVAHGYRVQHNGARGPYKGGLRYHPDIDLDEVRALASLCIETSRLPTSTPTRR